MKDFEIKTALSEGHYKAMLEVIESKGFTVAGYVRHLILKDVVESQELVSQMCSIAERAKTGRKPDVSVLAKAKSA